jgi:DHA2 family multidrug resistance protein-like MFS transporter
MTLVALDAGIATVALPTIARSLAVTPAAAVTVITAYQSALVMALLPLAAIGGRLGCRKVFITGVALFTAASLLCAAAPSLPLLLAARFLQGLGGAAVMALGVTLLRNTVPKGQLGRAIGWNALTVALAAAAGPAIGALVLTHAPWPWLFAINLPVGGLALIASLALPSTEQSSEDLDISSMMLSALMFGSAIAGAELWFVRPMLGTTLIALAAVSLVVLLRRELVKAAPVIPIDLLSSRSVRLSVIASILCLTGQTAALIALPFHLQNEINQSAFATGLYMAAWPLSVAATATISGYLSDRFSTAWLCAIGATLLAVGLGIAGLSYFGDEPWPLAVLLSLCGMGFGLFNVPNNRNMFLSAPPERSAAAGGLQGTARLLGQTTGAVLMTALFTFTAVDRAPRIGLIVAALLALVAGLVSTRRA